MSYPYGHHGADWARANRGGYDADATPFTRRCPTCNGSGIHPVLITRVCPKCHGEKRVPR